MSGQDVVQEPWPQAERDWHANCVEESQSEKCEAFSLFDRSRQPLYPLMKTAHLMTFLSLHTTHKRARAFRAKRYYEKARTLYSDVALT